MFSALLRHNVSDRSGEEISGRLLREGLSPRCANTVAGVAGFGAGSQGNDPFFIPRLARAWIIAKPALSPALRQHCGGGGRLRSREPGQRSFFHSPSRACVPAHSFRMLLRAREGLGLLLKKRITLRTPWKQAPHPRSGERREARKSRLFVT
jgi:hypothetical protein